MFILNPTKVKQASKLLSRSNRLNLQLPNAGNAPPPPPPHPRARLGAGNGIHSLSMQWLFLVQQHTRAYAKLQGLIFPGC